MYYAYFPPQKDHKASCYRLHICSEVFLLLFYLFVIYWIEIERNKNNGEAREKGGRETPVALVSLPAKLSPCRWDQGLEPASLHIITCVFNQVCHHMAPQPINIR